MSVKGEYLNLMANGNSYEDKCERSASAPLDNRNNHHERDIEDFLSDIGNKNMTVKENISESGSVTLNDDVRSGSEISLQYESVDNNVIGMLTDHVSVITSTDSVPIISTYTSIIESPLIDDSIHKKSDDNDKFVSNDFDNVKMQNENLKSLPFVSTSILTDSNENNNYKYQSIEKKTDLKIFSDQLNKLSRTIQQKDEEIQRLTQKLLELEGKESKSNKTETPSVVSPLPSLDALEPDEIKEKIKHVDVPEIFGGDCNITKDSIVNDTERSSPVVDIPINRLEEEVIPGIRLKLTNLEEEVKRLQQANVDSLLALHGIQNSTPTYDKSNNDSIINRLLVDHSLLKEELDQLKWEHSKLAQPNVLGDEIKQLKAEVIALRTQNEQLHKYIKSSSTKSLNTVPNHVDKMYSDDDFNDQDQDKETLQPHDRKFIESNSADYLYEKLNSKRRIISETPTVTTMLKHSIESLESPYHATCQSMQQVAPCSGGETFRTRKLSDSSSNLIEDVNPKAWIEPVSAICRPMYSRPSYESLRTPQCRPDFDQYSVDSFVTVTTSVTETDRDGWKYVRPNGLDPLDNMDLLSTVDSDTVLDSTNRDDIRRKPKYSYSFTPKSPSDLTLEDLVKFARPGGKMSTGRVCFVGNLPGRSEVCVGIELDDDAGKHDGVFEGVRYFQCRRNRGVFISFHKIILAYKSI